MKLSLLCEEAKPQEQPWIGVDLDGTLARDVKPYDPTVIGKVNPTMAARVRRWLRQGKKVKIFTARATDPKAIPYIKKWCLDNLGQELEVTNQKDQFMVRLWDDRAYGVYKDDGTRHGRRVPK
jgi:hydroxymethylpyrimidine pyrophosphatase-like HAD family hydrolase